MSVRPLDDLHRRTRGIHPPLLRLLNACDDVQAARSMPIVRIDTLSVLHSSTIGRESPLHPRHHTRAFTQSLTLLGVLRDAMTDPASWLGSTSKFLQVQPGVILKYPITRSRSSMCQRRADEIIKKFDVERQILEALGAHPRIVRYSSNNYWQGTHARLAYRLILRSDTLDGKISQAFHQGYSSPTLVTAASNTSSSRMAM
jgi:hypothetical protein